MIGESLFSLSSFDMNILDFFDGVLVFPSA